MDLQDLLRLGTQAQAALGSAREIYKQFTEAATTIRPTLAAKDVPALDQRLEALHEESMMMSKELDDAVKQQLLKARD